MRKVWFQWELFREAVIDMPKPSPAILQMIIDVMMGWNSNGSAKNDINVEIEHIVNPHGLNEEDVDVDVISDLEEEEKREDSLLQRGTKQFKRKKR